MDKLEELLPGIEEFLTNTLASESLTNFAEERRQYFVERLDIVNLPPSVPPREGRVLPLELLKETEESSGIPADHGTADFAATQREISRSFIDHGIQADVSSDDKEVKVYDDIDPPNRRNQDCTRSRTTSEDNQQITNLNSNGKDESDDSENGQYEVPVSKQDPVDDYSVSCGTDEPRLATSGSTEELTHQNCDPTRIRSSTGDPPPIPARIDRSLSEPRSSTNDKGDRPPDLPFRPPLPKRNEIYTRSDKSDRSETEKSLTSDPDLSGDGDSTSYESFDEDNDAPNTEIASQFDVKLPKKPKQKTTLRRNGKIRKSLSPLQWEIDVPFQKLDNIDISGELFDKGKLKWNKRIVAISNGHMLVYKPEKDARPSLVIPLTGYDANVHEREGKKGYEVRMVHTDGEYHNFCLELREWAQLWTEHINGHAKGHPPPKYHTHLAGSLCDCADFYNPPTYGSKNDLTASDVCSSTEAGTDDAAKGRGKRKKVTRMGSFAFRATQFLENIGKKTSGRRKSPHQLTCRHSSGDTTDTSRKPSDLSVSSTGSLGSLTRGLVSPTSDSSVTSLFGESSTSSPPPTPGDVTGPARDPWDAGRNVDCSDIACKSHLLIFSNFNKRCWGKRWCLVRGNMFECYKNEQANQCELTFPLKLCLLRRAVSETNSENGLMIVEADKEKITIEPLSKHEMGQWVRVLLTETSSEGIPDGLEAFLQEENSAELSRSADIGRHVSSHEYEDPEETLAEVARLQASCSAQQAAGSPTTAEKNANIVLLSDHVKVPDSLTLSQKYNQTTDSGFYSVKGAISDSDSDSSCGKSSVNDKLGGYSTIDLLKTYTSSSSQPTHTSRLQSSQDPAHEFSFPHEPFTNEHQYASSSSSSLSTSQPLSSLISKAQVKTPASVTISQHKTSQEPVSPKSKTNSVRKTNIAENTEQYSHSARRTSQTVVSPSGEEYSIILKRSERAWVSQIPSVHPSCSSVTSDRKSAALIETGKNTPSEINLAVKNSINVIVDTKIKSSICSESISKKSEKTITLAEPRIEPTSKRPSSSITQMKQKFDSTNDQPPPLPRSPVPNCHRDSGTFSKSIPTTHQTVEASMTAPHQPDSPDTVNKNSKFDESLPDVQETWKQLLNKPNATIEELTSVIDVFKIKHVEIRRKKMAVHDKRQRVVSDEERLACEKEFAALEKLGESTDHTIRTLQNHVANLQGHTLGTAKTTPSRYSFK